MHLQLGVCKINKTECLSKNFVMETTKTIVHQFSFLVLDTSILKVDPIGEYAYGFLAPEAFIYDINNGNVTLISWQELLPDLPEIYRKDADVTMIDDNIRMIVLVGYSREQTDSSLPVIYLLRHEPPSTMILVDSLILINDTFVGDAFAFGYTFDYVMSVSIEHTTQQILVGLPYFGKTFLLKFTSTNLTLMKEFPYAARSVAWIDNGTQAVLLFADIPTLPWASSQVQVINTSVTDTHLATLYAVPNNQQTIAFKTGKSAVDFLRITVSNGLPIILTSTGYVIYAPIAPPDSYIGLTEISSIAPSPVRCPAGTFKTHTGPSPCIVCATGFKRSVDNRSLDGSSSNLECTPCSSTSYCPLASVNDINQSSYPSFNQGYPYPNSPASTNFDDIIITNTFQISSTNRRCLLVSPIFWTLLVLGLTGIILIIMGILYWTPNGRRHFQWLTNIFRRTDIVGEGELWVGGLMSFALLVLITFGFWFGFVYVKEYPIETAGDASFACDTSLRNAKFSSSLQLLALLKTEEEIPVFELLDQQNWTLVVDFIQTGFQCKDIAAEANIESYKIKLPITNCSQQPDNATRTLVVPLTTHLITVQFNLTGNSYVGASRICIHGPSISREESYSSIKELSFCHLISNTDQTISQQTIVKLDFTKVINRTEGLDINDPVTYSGIWIPTVTIRSLNDRIAYEQQGTYLRYLSSQQTISIALSETQFFIKNTQEPIARSGEVIFHNILFSTVCIELFGLAFLLFKLALLPLLKFLIKKAKDQCYCIHSTTTKL
ncbi:hypothetical protein I4U23_014934 [Adineta vaga]|nr:hypothetical protein I4U23_014934 [Adineta vaga]